MAVRLGTKTTTIAPDHEEPAPEIFMQRKKPESGQFRLQVAVHDAAEGVNKIIELPHA